jgi:Tfp pilus assembly protein PilO
MPDLGKTRRKLKIAIAAMVVVDAVAAGVLFSPLVGSAESRRVQLNQLSAELQKKTHAVQPLRGMDKKIVLAKNQIGEFYQDRFAAKDSELATELGKLAAENGIRIQQARYKQEEGETSGIVPVAIDGSFSGDYLQLVRFINTLERSKMFITVDSVNLAGEGTGQVHLQITLHSYLRSGV